MIHRLLAGAARRRINATSVVVLTELAKLGLALALYRYYDGTWLQLGRGTVAAWRRCCSSTWCPPGCTRCTTS